MTSMWGRFYRADESAVSLIQDEVTMSRCQWSRLPIFFALLIFVPALAAPIPAGPALAGFPFTDEALNYSINWPSGLNLGEGHLLAKRAGTGWSFELTLDASVPGFDVKDSYAAHAGADFCSADFSKQFVHGARKGGENETID